MQSRLFPLQVDSFKQGDRRSISSFYVRRAIADPLAPWWTMAPPPNMVSHSFEGRATSQAAKMMPSTPSTMMPSTPSTPSGHDDAASEAGSSRFPMTGTSAASSAPVSLASSSGHGRLAACHMVFFVCKMCKIHHPLSDMSARANVCNRDNSTYKSIAFRWSKQTDLKTWYDKISDEQRAAWYLKQQQLPKGSKRNFEQIACSESTSSLASSRNMKSRDVKEQATFRGANVSTSEQLQVLQHGDRAILDQFRNTFQGAQTPMPSDMPLTDATAGDQPMTPAPADLMSQQIHPEATVG
jgi:hypothetical protein